MSQDPEMTEPSDEGLERLIERLENGADRFLKWAYKELYSGPPVLSIPRHDDNIDALLIEAASELRRLKDDLLEARKLVTRYAREAGEAKGRLETSEAASALLALERERDEAREDGKRFYETGLEAGRAEGAIIKAELEAAESRVSALEAELERVKGALRGLLAFADEVVAVACQENLHRGEWGVECPLCMGELVEQADRATIEQARAALSQEKAK